MRVGLGTGSTAIFATRRIAQLQHEGKLNGVVGFATSRATADEARRLGISLMSDDLPHELDITIDGADEVAPDLNVIKGGGGALLREKIVAQASRRFVVVVDETKWSEKLGEKHAVPIEVLRFGWRSQLRFLEEIGAEANVRAASDGSAYQTDSGNMIIDCDFGRIEDVRGLAAILSGRAGIVEHGLFVDLATDVVIAGIDGVRHLTRG
jgi:ribose 5-phosphate isomerase A